MATEITFRRGSNDPTSGSGITLAEPVFNTTNHTFHIGLGYGITAEWVGAPISGLSADIAAGITYKIPTAAAVKNYISTVGGVAGATGATGATGSQGATGATGAIPTDYVVSFNGATGAIQGVSSVNGQTGAVTIASATNVVTSFNGLTGAIQGVSSVNGQTGAVTIASSTNVVSSFNGLTGAVQGVSAAIAGTGISVSGATGAVTITNIGVQSFNGNTGAVTGASLGANTFTALNTFNAGITTAFIYASTGSTFGGTLQVNGGATFDGRVYVGGDLYVYNTFTSKGTAQFDRSVNFDGGVTFALTTDHAGVARFAAGLTTSSLDVSGAARFTNGLTSAGDIRFTGTATKNIRSNQAPIVITGITTDIAASVSNTITLPVTGTQPLQLASASGNVNIVGNSNGLPSNPGLRIVTDDTFVAFGTIIKPGTYASAERTQTLQDASGIIALTSQLMGAVNGSTAATTAVTSFNGLTGAVQGVSAAAAGDGIAVSGATGAVTITNTGVTRAVAGTGISVSGATGSVTITNIGVQSFNGNTGAVQGVSAAVAGTGISVSGATGAVTITNTGVQSFNGLTGAVTGVTVGGTNVFTALNTFNAGISAAGGVTFSGDIAVNGGDITTTSATATVFNTTATTLSIGGAATALTIGAASGVATIRNPTLNIGTTYGLNYIGTPQGSGSSLYIQPFGTLYLAPTTNAAYIGSFPQIIINNTSGGLGKVSVEGGNLHLGVKTTNDEDYTAVDLVFEGASQNSNQTTVTVVDPTADRTITFPDASGTVALTSGLVSSLSGSTFISVSGSTGSVTITNTGVQSFNGNTGAVTGVTVGGTNVFTALNSFNAGISAAGGVTLAGTLQGTTASFTGLVSSTVGFSGSGTNLKNIVTTFNGLSGAVTGVTVGGANTFTALNSFNAGISASTITTDYLVVAGGSTFGAAVDHVFGLSNRGLKINAGKGNSEILSYGNETLDVNALGGNGTLNLFGGNVTVGDDGNNDGTQIIVDDATSQSISYTAANGHVFNGVGSFSGLLTISAGISGAGATFNAPVNLRNTLLINSTQGSNNQVLTSTGSGITWATPSGGGSSVTSFNGLTGAVTGVSRVNGLSGGITFAAGTGITFSTSGNIITVASAPNSTTQTLDFSETINGIQLTIGGTGASAGTDLSLINKAISIVPTISTSGITYSCVFVSATPSYSTTTSQWAAKLILKPPFGTGVTSASTIIAAPITQISLYITGLTGNTYTDNWTNISGSDLYHQDATYVVKTVTGQTWVTADSYIECKVLGLTTADHTPEDAILEGVKFEINNIVAGTGFDIIGHAPEGTYGKYTIKCLGQ